MQSYLILSKLPPLTFLFLSDLFLNSFLQTCDKADPQTTKYTSLSTDQSSSDTQTTSVTLVAPAEEVETPCTLSSI